MWIHIDENGYILGHDYKETITDTIQISVSDLFDCAKCAYNYKYINGELVKINDNEQDNQPQVINIKLSLIRQKRDRLLKDSDFSVLEDSPKDKVAWKVYRKSLRDLTDNIDVDNVNWPINPGEVV